MRLSVLVLLAAAAFLFAPAARADLAGCRAAYEAHDAVGVCEECAELVMDGAVPEDPNVWIYLGLAQWKLGELNHQIINGTYKKASGEGRTSPWDLLQQGRYEEARAFGTWFAARAWYQEWIDHKNELKPKQQIPYLDRAIELEPHHDVLFARGKLLEEMGKKDLALKDYRQSYIRCRQVSLASHALSRLQVMDPEGLKTLLPDEGPGLAHAQALAQSGPVDEALAAFNACQRAMPGNRAVWVAKAEFLLAAGRPAGALRVATGMLAWQDLIENRRFRAELAARSGNDELAMQDWATIVERDATLNGEIYPAWSAAQQRVRDRRCGSPTANLREALVRRGTWVQPAGNTAPRKAPPGFLTQWQDDGALKVFLPWGPGFFLQEDGISYQKIQDDGTRGPVTPPETLADGRAIYPLGHMVLIHVPAGDLYCGVYELWAGKSEGSYSDCADVPQEGPFRFGLSALQRRVVDKTETQYTEGGETRVLELTKLADGTQVRIVKATYPEQAERERSVTIPGLGRFVGETMTLDYCAPQRGVMYYDNGSWGIIHQTQLRALGTRGQPLSVENLSLSAEGLLSITTPNDIVTFDANGVMGYASLVEEVEPEPEVTADATYTPAFDFQASLEGNRPRNCYRCRGAGQIWQAGGATQSSVGAASSMSASERESHYKSASSLRTTYSSGTMIVCPACGGSGRP